ncbi:hypothetical protein CAAU_1437 [Caloramator australicus RC3]|uniref:Uncharacterized protein n=1 Tax=Caloramator australicus RC3 TaxID=857293 RepID=I7J570_9CLOT|nr:hypothetical protein CAAU_1437 [Caloramator australicus RC3]
MKFIKCCCIISCCIILFKRDTPLLICVFSTFYFTTGVVSFKFFVLFRPTIILHYDNGINNPSEQHQLDENNLDSEKIETEKKAEIESTIIIDNTKVKNYEQLASLSENLKNQLEILNNKIDSLEMNLANLFSRSKETNISDKNTSVEITQMINQILESNNEKISVQINKELLSRAARYIDNKSLIKLETIVKEGHDINSTILQYILILFIQQNSLF